MKREECTYHLPEQVCCRGTSGHSYTNRLRQTLGLLGCTQKSVDSRGRIEMCDMFFLQKLPDEGVVDLTQTIVCTSSSSDGPTKRRTY